MFDIIYYGIGVFFGIYLFNRLNDTEEIRDISIRYGRLNCFVSFFLVLILWVMFWPVLIIGRIFGVLEMMLYLCFNKNDKNGTIHQSK